jgi:predicted tellurium resistance membrane protein TerC
MEWLTDPQGWIALATLTALEIVLGIDNIIFISILAGKLPAERQRSARMIGLGLAMFIRIALLFSLVWMMRLTAPLFQVIGEEISGRDLILISGGLFLLAKSTREIHDRLEGEEGDAAASGRATFGGVIVQILLLDIVFSFDSIITAIGMSNQVGVMVSALIVAVIFMMVFSGVISAFIERHPTIKMLAVSFLLLIGMALVADGFGLYIPKGYIYFAMAFSVFVEMLNLGVRRRATAPVKLRHRYTDEPPPTDP